MHTRQIGDTKVSAIGLGGMPMSIEGRPEESRSIATIHAALDAGVTLIDTADAYHLGADDVGHNESLIAEALATYGGDTSDVLVATKGGHPRPGDGSLDPRRLARAPAAGVRGVPAAARRRGHRALPVPPARPGRPLRGVDRRAARPARRGQDPDGRHLQRRPRPDPAAHEILGGRLVSVQNQFSPAFRSSEAELRLCDELGIAFLPWSPLGGITSAARARHRATRPFAEVAEEHEASPQQVSLAWMLAKSPVVIPIPGSSRPETIRASAAAVDLQLTPEQVRRLDRASDGVPSLGAEARVALGQLTPAPPRASGRS